MVLCQAEVGYLEVRIAREVSDAVQYEKQNVLRLDVSMLAMVSAGRIGTMMILPGGRARNIWNSCVDVLDRLDEPKQLFRKPDGRRAVSQSFMGVRVCLPEALQVAVCPGEEEVVMVAPMIRAEELDEVRMVVVAEAVESADLLSEGLVRFLVTVSNSLYRKIRIAPRSLLPPVSDRYRSPGRGGRVSS